MNVIYNLFKKDFLLIKKYLLTIFMFIIIAPTFISYSTPVFQKNANILYGILVLMITFMTYHSISLEEMKQKGEVYLKITPIRYIKVVIAKYVVVNFTFIVTTTLFLILSKIPFMCVGKIDIKTIFIYFALIEMFFGIYIPMTFKFGYVKLQIISAGIIFICPFVTVFIINHFQGKIQLISSIQNSSTLLITGLSSLIICIFVSFGIIASNKIIKDKEY